MFNSISKKTAVFILLASTVVSLFVTFAEIFFDYSREKQKIADALAYIEKSQFDSLSNSLWRFDRVQIEAIAKGILSTPDFKNVKIFVDGNLAPLVEKGELAPRSTSDSWVSWDRNLEILKDGRKVLVGRIAIEFSYEYALKRTFEILWSVLLSQLVRSIIVGFIMIFLIEYMIIKRIKLFENYLSNYSAKNKSQSNFKLASVIVPDEIDHLIDASNQLLRDIEEYQQRVIDETLQKKEAQARLDRLSLQLAGLQANAGLLHDLSNLIQVAMVQNKKMERSKENIAGTIENQAKSLKLMAEVVKTHQRASAKTDKLLECSIVDLVSETLALEENSLNSHKIAVSLFVPNQPKYIIPRNLLILVLLNLIKNAREALAETRQLGRAIHIKFVDLDDAWELSVCDNGPGVGVDFIDKLFVFGETSKAEGNGFGISQCKKSLNMYGGDLLYRPAPQGGAEFVIKFPKNIAYTASETEA